MTRTRVPLVLAAAGLVASALLAVACNDATDGQTLFRATLSGANEVPVRDTAGSGSAGFTLDGDTVFFAVEVSQMDQITMAHIHSQVAGVNGPVRVDLFLGPVTGQVNGRLVEGSFTAANVRGVTFEQILEQMRTGRPALPMAPSGVPGLPGTAPHDGEHAQTGRTGQYL